MVDLMRKLYLLSCATSILFASFWSVVGKGFVEEEGSRQTYSICCLFSMPFKSLLGVRARVGRGCHFSGLGLSDNCVGLRA